MHYQTVALLMALTALPCCKLTRDSNVETVKPITTSLQTLRDKIGCKPMSSPDQLKPGECTAKPTGALTAGDYKFSSIDNAGDTLACWSVQGLDTTTTENNIVIQDIGGTPFYTNLPYTRTITHINCAMQGKSRYYDPATSFIQMQEDGNAVFYASEKILPAGESDPANIYASTQTGGNNGAILTLKDNGDLKVNDVSGKELWSKVWSN